MSIIQHELTQTSTTKSFAREVYSFLHFSPKSSIITSILILVLLNIIANNQRTACTFKGHLVKRFIFSHETEFRANTQGSISL